MFTTYVLGSDVFRFAFESGEVNPSELRRSDGWKWAEVPRIGERPALQFIGEEAATITMTGKILNGFLGKESALGRAGVEFVPARYKPVVSSEGEVVFNPNVRMRQNALEKSGYSLAEMADMGIPMTLTNGNGDCFGRWVVTRIERTHRVFFVDGIPRVSDFTIELKRYA